MAEDPDDISLGFGDDGVPSVTVDETDCVTPAALAAAAPWLLTPAHATLAAEALNHLVGGPNFQVIEDPADFAQWYRTRYAEEAEGEVRPDSGFGLRQFGLPDLDALHAPRIEADTLVFFAVNRALGAPYRVRMSLSQPEAADYDPLPMEDDA